MQTHKTVSREEWITARRVLLEKEKAHLRAQDEIARQRRELLLGKGREGLRVRRG